MMLASNLKESTIQIPEQPVIARQRADRRLWARNLLPFRVAGASAAISLAILICVLLTSVTQARAQTGPGASSKPEDENNLGYDAGYQAGLRAAGKLAAESAATVAP